LVGLTGRLAPTLGTVCWLGCAIRSLGRAVLAREGSVRIPKRRFAADRPSDNAYTLWPMVDIERARLYLCTDRRTRTGDLEQFLDAVLAGGVDVIQLREKGLEARDELAALEVFAAAAQRHEALSAVNDRADIARAAGAPILHLGQRDIPTAVARRIVGDDVIIGRSTHDPQQADAARAEDGVSDFCTGPVWATPTKPGRPAAGLELVEHAASQGGQRPWFAIGGIENLERLDTVMSAGARRAVVVRALTDAEDPGAAAAAFAGRLAGL